jgi:hypothetical protein
VLAVTMGLPFLAVALAGLGPGGETRVVTLLAAALTPVAACAGLAWRAQFEATERTAAAAPSWQPGGMACWACASGPPPWAVS